MLHSTTWLWYDSINDCEGFVVATLIFITSYIVYVVLLSINYLIWIPVWMILSYALAFLTVLGIYLLNLPLVLILPSTHPYKFYLMKSIAFLVNHFVLRLKVTVDGIENIPPSGNMIIYANHKAYSDGFALLEILTRPMTFTPKLSVMKLPIIGLWLKSYDVFPINRENPRETFESMVKAADTVKKGLVISIFPEGTIKYRENLKVTEMKPGAFKLAHMAESNILVIRFEGNDLTKNRTPFRSTKRHLTIFPAIPYEMIKDQTSHQIALKVMNIINDN